MSDDAVFSVGSAAGDHVIVRPRRYTYPGATEYWDANWVDASLEVAAGAFRGRLDAQLCAHDFPRWRDDLRMLHAKLEGVATLETTEPWIELSVEGDGRGHFVAKAVVRDGSSFENRLSFETRFDQTDIPEMLRAT